jgi:hypothetical protein
LLTGMTGISLHMQWPLTSQLASSGIKFTKLHFGRKILDSFSNSTFGSTQKQGM